MNDLINNILSYQKVRELRSCLWLCQFELIFVVIDQLPHLDRPQMILVAQGCVVIEQIPFALEFDDRVMSRPTLDRLQNTASVCKGAQRAVADSIYQVVSVTSRVREVVFALVLVHPGCLEESTIVLAGVDRLAVNIVDNELLDVAAERPHVVAQLSNSREERRLVTAGFHGAVGFTLELARSPALQLATPDTAKVQISLTVLVDEAGRIYTVRSLDGLGIRLERAFRLVTDGYADAEDAFFIPSWEVQVVLAILLGSIRSLRLVSLRLP